MEIDEYLERDILKFLDSKVVKIEKSIIDREDDYGIYMTKDYLKELMTALENDELTKAKRLFDELKAQYNKLPKNSTEKNNMYSVLEKMYEEIQGYMKIKEGKISIIKQGSSEVIIDNEDLAAKTKSKDDTPGKRKRILEGSNKFDDSEEGVDLESPGNLMTSQKRILGQTTVEREVIIHDVEKNGPAKQTDKRIMQKLMHDHSKDMHEITRMKEDIMREMMSHIKKIRHDVLAKLNELEVDSKIEKEDISEIEKRLDTFSRSGNMPRVIKVKSDAEEPPEGRKYRAEKIIIEDIEEQPKKNREKIADAQPKKHRLKRNFMENEMQEIYEAGIYNMFQNNYAEASKIFYKILETHPNNRAAKIRLAECEEVINNAG